MKLIIEIPEEQYNDIVKYLTNNDGNYAYSDFNLREIIRNGTPYNPSGDAISREALKDITYINKGNFNTVEGIREWIDNAPTVNTNAIADNEKSQGDLISREALRKEVTEKVNFTTVDGHIAYDKMLKLIDNAPTVPLPNEQIAWEQGYEAGLAQGKHDRPQGEWIKVKEERMSVDMSGDIVTRYKCSKCGRVIATLPSKLAEYYPFCHCGAKMKGGAE